MTDMVYKMFFLGRNFVYGVDWTPNPQKTLKAFKNLRKSKKCKNLKPTKIYFKNLRFTTVGTSAAVGACGAGIVKAADACQCNYVISQRRELTLTCSSSSSRRNG